MYTLCKHHLFLPQIKVPTHNWNTYAYRLTYKMPLLPLIIAISAVGEWCRFPDLQVAGSNPDGATFFDSTLSKLFTGIY